MIYENLLYGVEERVCTITLNRPQKMNALSWALRQEFKDALKTAERDTEVGCIVVKGAGRAFSAGYDMTPSKSPRNVPANTYVSEDVDQITGQYARDLLNTWWQIWDLTKPVIAQVHGWCLAGASELASMCDLMFVAEDAQFGYPPVRVMAGPDLMYFPWKMPMSQAKYLMLTGRPVSGREAADMGWATKAFPSDQLGAETTREARAIASISADRLAASKMMVNRAYEIMGYRTALEVGVDWQALSSYGASRGLFRDKVRAEGLKAALKWRDGPFGDYSARPRE